MVSDKFYNGRYEMAVGKLYLVELVVMYSASLTCPSGPRLIAAGIDQKGEGTSPM